MRTQSESVVSKSKRQAPPASRAFFALFLTLCFGIQSLSAQTFKAQTPPMTRIIVRTSLGLGGVLNLCKILGCSNAEALGDPQGQLFMIQTPASLNGITSLLNISVLGLVSIETDQNVQTQEASAGVTPNYLNDEAPFSYYGTSVWHGYVSQPGNQLIRTDATHAAFNAGNGVIVADIDTGVDATHPVLKNVLISGYDFTRNSAGGSEMGDVTQSSVAVLDKNPRPARVSQSAVAVLDQSAVAVLDGPGYEAFGHGTMTAGIIHLVAPQAQIMPLKAFKADGSGYDSDILRAIYYAVNHGAKVINMSFNYTTYSQELANAVNYANANGVICVAAAGNSGVQATVYPAALKGVIDVASTSNNDTPSSFSNYGAPPVWLSAPGEGVMTTYPFGTYAAGWGTSFSTPMVSGTAALMLSQYKSNPPVAKGLLGLILQLLTASTTEPQAASALAHTQQIPDPQMGKGRLDTYQAMQAWHNNLGLR
ncbi:MAG TPA: S8 family serine peptidase [Terriglobales bacterium]|nr:S8 family serine peptidase [Terriglobales bacterium]